MKVLIVEDSFTQASLMSKIVSKIKTIEPILALDALDGYAILRAIPEIEAVILDYNMPYINGIDFLRKLRHTPQFEELPVLISSAEDLTEEYMKTGATACLIKPYDVAKLKEFVKEIQEKNAEIRYEKTHKHKKGERKKTTKEKQETLTKLKSVVEEQKASTPNKSLFTFD